MNGLYEAVLALANSSAVLGVAEKQAQDDIQAANLVNAILQKIKDFNNNMEQIELFLQKYIDNHAPGTKEGDKMTAGESKAVSQLSTMLDKMKADDAKIDSETKLVNQYAQEATDAKKNADNIDLSGWHTFITFGGNKVDYANFLGQAGIAAANATHHQGLVTDAENDRAAVLSVKTGDMSTEATTLSTAAQSALDQIEQIMRSGFLFLSAIDNNERRI